MVTPSTTPTQIVERQQTRNDPSGTTADRWPAETLNDAQKNIDRVPPEGLVFIDTTDSIGQRDLAMVRRSPTGVDLLLHVDDALRVQRTNVARVVGVPMTRMTLPDSIAPEQAIIAARYPRVALQHEGAVILVTNDLRNHNLVDDRGLLQYKIAWEVQHATVVLEQLMDEDPSRYTLWLDVWTDRRAGVFGSPVVWLQPDDIGLPWYRILWKWERLPQWQGHAWFAYATRVVPKTRR